MQRIAPTYLSFSPLVSRIGLDARVLALMDQIDFAVSDSYIIDITAVVQSSDMAHAPQSMFVDASRVLYGATVVQVFGTGQRIVVPPATEGFYPLLLTGGSFIFTLTNGGNLGVGAAPMDVCFMNVPYVASQWSTAAAATGGYGVGGLGANPLGS